jgi:murein DD-endopeptidase MepM/ murein hydrolase activator NlpD
MPGDTGFEQYMATCAKAYWDRATVGFSYDDACIGDLDDKSAWLYDIPNESHQEFQDWVDTYYPGTQLSWPDLPHVGRNPGIELHMPLDGAPTMTQLYGENYTLYMARFGLPGHNGLDWAVPVGSPVKMAAPGQFDVSGYDPNGYGNYVIIDHGEGVKTVYAHLSVISEMTGGVWYDTGTLVGQSGNSGWSDGPHLHFGIKVDGRYRDPAQWLV